ncbi:TetR/AcrR family transcriptional regulator [Streptomyces griseoflavus]|uniref:TetR/AcrR family transcriptional regulator n=1 Tax=Streptomyces griseoflavus TaxID=35619 RepID=UPI00339F17BC
MGEKRTLGVVVDASGAHRRDLDARERVIATTMKMLGERGYAKLTIGGVAAEAGVGKATLYRSWPNKAALVLDGIRSELREVPTEDLGDSRAEMVALASQALGRFYGSDRIRSVLPALVGDLSEDSALRRRLWEEIVEGRKKQSMTVMQRALDRGDLPPDTDISMVLDMWAGTMLFRSLFSDEAVDDKGIERMVDATLAAPPRRPGPADA